MGSRPRKRMMKVELEDKRKLVAMLRDKGANQEDEEHVVRMLKNEGLSKGQSQDENRNITWTVQNKEREVLHKIRRNWCLPIGQVFDMRAPDAWGERWDFSRRADRRLAWRELAKEEAMLVVIGRPLAHRGK